MMQSYFWLQKTFKSAVRYGDGQVSYTAGEGGKKSYGDDLFLRFS